MAELTQAQDQEQVANELPQAELPQGQAAPEVAQAEAAAPVKHQASVAVTSDNNVEIEGKLGEYGEYSVDLRPSGDVVSQVNGTISKAFFGFITVEGSGKVAVTADLYGGLLTLAEKSGKSWLQGIASKLRSLTGR